MSFSGKKFRRTHYDNITALVRATDTSAQTMRLLTCKAPVFSFIRLDEKMFVFKMILENTVLSYRFRLDEEFEIDRYSGTKVRMTFSLEGDDVLNQIIKLPDGRITYFRREFGNSNKMIVTTEGSSQRSVVYYELIK